MGILEISVEGKLQWLEKPLKTGNWNTRKKVQCSKQAEQAKQKIGVPGRGRFSTGLDLQLTALDAIGTSHLRSAFLFPYSADDCGPLDSVERSCTDLKDFMALAIMHPYNVCRQLL